MTMTTIHRIPKLDSDDITMARVINTELDNWQSPLDAILRDMGLEDNTEEHLSVCLDWAMEIRMEFGISWAECLHVAQVLYFG